MKHFETQKSLKFALYLIVFLAGFAFVSYEINLFRALSNLFGSTITASTITLSIFMAGYGIGAYYIGRKIKTKDRFPLLIGLMLGLSISGLSAYILIQWGISKIYFDIDTTGIGWLLKKTLSYSLASLLLMLPSFFMGGILPISTQIMQSLHNKVINSISTLYTFDTLGGVLGGLLTTFLLNKYLGQLEAVFIVTAVVLFPVLVLRPFFRDFTFENSDKHDEKKFILSPKIKRYLIAAAFIGFAVNAFQILMIRVFKIYLINTIYAFTLITTAVISGLFIGSYLIKIRKTKITPATAKILLLFMGILILMVALVAKHIPDVIMFPLSSLFPTEIFRAFWLPVIILIITTLPIATLSGYLFPTLVGLSDETNAPHGKLVSAMLAANTVGSVLGPLTTAFIFIPVLGIGRSLILTSVLPILLIPYLKSGSELFTKGFIPKIALVAAGTVTYLFITTLDYKIVPPSFVKNKTKVLVYRETLEGNYVVGEEVQQNGTRVLSTFVNNSAVIGTTYDAIKVVKMVGHLPFLFGLKAEKALVVGFGIGVTTAAIAAHPEIKRVDCVELVKDLTQVAHFYSDINNNIHLDNRLHFYQDDGRHFLQQTSQKYDLISSDPTHPILGSGNLYTREYWELCKKKLNPDGMISQYLPIHKLTLNDFLGIVKTFHHVFPNSAVFVGHFHAVLIGSIKELSFDFNSWEQNSLKTSSDRLFYNNPYHLAATLMFDSNAITELTRHARLNTDNHPWTDYFNFDALKEENLWKNLHYLNKHRSAAEQVFTNVSDSVLLKRFFKGNFYLTEGLVEFHRGNAKGLFQFLEKAAMVNPENVEYPLLLQFYSLRNRE